MSPRFLIFIAVWIAAVPCRTFVESEYKDIQAQYPKTGSGSDNTHEKK
jgi:hypothetical protein